MNGPTSLLGQPRSHARRTLLRTGGVALSLTLVAACQTETARRTSPRFETAFTSTAPTDNRPLVSLPNSGPVQSVEETRSTASLRQRILYGQSRGRVDLTIASGQVWDDPAMAKPSRAGIAAELASLQDGGSYRIVRRPVQNAYGPIGVALNQRCAYAWQWLDNLQRVELGRASLRGPVAVSLRVQHCGLRPMAAEALLADIARIRLGVTSDAMAGSPRPRLARAPLARAPLERPRPTAEPVATTAPVVPTANPPVQIPSSPSVAVNGSRTLVMLPPAPTDQPYLAQPASPPASQTVPAVPRPATAGGAPDRARFLTDALPPAGRAPQSATAEAPTRASSGSRPPPAGW
ncbi:cellulose biosynthesis protein BcsN [Methylobacterium flocculans]|uniref:cellulose biosynthesis protein BcsN n=1 Tax=Methylobacterium flocculans TaxID=2984843 RepID=UPI0021F34188|nr:cellulose biosynthesis protein BcsN [Methylobacterium sp. FF17]